jgi:hypothetical protein
MEAIDLETLRKALLITLSILLVIVLFRRFRRDVRAKDTPALLHAELKEVDLAYHPARLRIVLKVPKEQRFTASVLDRDHRTVHSWPENSLSAGTHALELGLPDLEDGPYFLEMTTATQRTVRQFRLLQG